MPKTNSLYTRVRGELITVQSNVDNNSPVHTNITILTQQLQSLEALELHNINQRHNTDLRRPRPPPKFPSRPNIIETRSL
jgi:hypothetical protein